MRELLRSRAARLAAAFSLAASLVLPAVVPASAADPLVLRAGTDQKIKSLNPFAAVVVAEYEAFTLNYDLLTNWGADIEPVSGFAESWSASPDGKTWTFKISKDLKWSDGTPATSEDARWTYQLMLDATAKETTLGSGYLDAYLPSAGVTKVSAPDPQTFVVETEYPNQLLFSSYVPILPAHVWSKVAFDDIASGAFTNPVPVVGTGPYQAVEFKEGEYTRLVKNPYWRGPQPLAADEVILQTFASSDTMVQALKNGEIDYVRGIQPDQWEALKGEPNIVAVEGATNGYTEVAFNGYSRSVDGGPPGVIPGGGASTTALQDVKFRDALGYAIDNQVLVDKVLAGHGTPGSTIVPPFHTRWHVEPETPRTFDIEKAKSLLDAAGYKLTVDDGRLDKEGKPITLRVTWPDSEPENGTIAQFLADWWGQLGIKVDAAVTEEGQLIEDVLPPEADGKAKFDVELWGWVGDVDPDSLLKFFQSSEIGVSSDSFYENPEYDTLYQAQLREVDPDKRHELMAQMQQIVYRDAPYHVLYYDSELDAYRTDRFTNWKNQPSTNGTPLFEYGSFGYWGLQPAAAAATPSPEASVPPSGEPSAAPTAAPDAGETGGGDNTALLAGGAVAVIVIVAGAAWFLMRRRRPTGGEEE